MHQPKNISESTCILWILLSPHIHPPRAARPARFIGLAEWVVGCCWAWYRLQIQVSSAIMNHQNWTGFRKTLSSFHRALTDQCLETVSIDTRGLSTNLRLGNAAMVLSQFCISHFVGKNKHVQFPWLYCYVLAPEAKWRRDTQKTATPAWLQEVCENWWWCGSVALSHSCERSRRNGGRWWPQVRERWCGCFRNLPHAGDCVKSSSANK